MVLKETGILREFDLVIYPVPFIVAIGKVEEDINKRYAPLDPQYDRIGKCRGAAATTYQVKDKKTGDYCILIWVYDPSDFKSSIVPHECNHAAFEIFHYVGAKIQYDDQEPFCYLSGNLNRLATGTYYKLKDYQTKQTKEK